MVQISGKYQHVKDENLAQLFKAIDCPPDLIEKATQPDLAIEVVDDGNGLTLKASFGESMSYVYGEEVEEPLLKGAKSIYTRQGDVVTVSSKTADGHSMTKHMNFTDDGFTAVVTLDGTNIIAKRHFRRI